MNAELDTQREAERQITLHRKYDRRVRAAISIWESYPGCSKPPMSNPSPKIGLHELKAWAKEEQKSTKPGTPKHKDLQGLYDVCKLDIKRDFAEPLVWKVKPLRNAETNEEQKGDGVKAGDAEKEQSAKKIIAALLISLLIICAFILSVWLIPFLPFTWVINHPRSYGIQGSIICLIPCLIFGIFKPKWRKWCWGTAAIAFLVGLLSLL